MATWLQALFNPLEYDSIAAKVVRLYVHRPCLVNQCGDCLNSKVFVTPTEATRGTIALVYEMEVTCYFSLMDMANDLALSGVRCAVVRCGAVWHGTSKHGLPEHSRLNRSVASYRIAFARALVGKPCRTRCAERASLGAQHAAHRV